MTEPFRDAGDTVLRMDAGDTVLRMEGVEKRFGATHALRGVSFEVRRGEGMMRVGPHTAQKCAGEHEDDQTSLHRTLQ